MRRALPDGFERIEENAVLAVLRRDLVSDVKRALRSGSLLDYARAQPGAASFRGRGEVLAITAPESGVPIVVRRSRHGGLLRAITRDLFLRPGRAPGELRLAQELRGRGIRTPEVLGYVLYLLPAFLCRVDVITRRVSGSRDLAALLATSTDHAERSSALRATAALLVSLESGRAHHPDLNLRNVLISAEEPAVAAWLLDVDRVRLDVMSSAESGAANLRRLLRSARKLRAREGLSLSDEELAWLVSHSADNG